MHPPNQTRSRNHGIMQSWNHVAGVPSGFLVVSMHRHRGKRRSELATGISTNKASGTPATQDRNSSSIKSKGNSKNRENELLILVILLLFPGLLVAGLQLQRESRLLCGEGRGDFHPRNPGSSSNRCRLQLKCLGGGLLQKQEVKWFQPNGPVHFVTLRSGTGRTGLCKLS